MATMAAGILLGAIMKAAPGFRQPPGPRAACSHAGSGTSAMMAMLEARGMRAIGQTIQSEGPIGSGTFEGCLLGETSLNGTRAVRPTIKGKAGLLGTARWTIDRDDPVAAGFLVG
jgi:proline racemase